MTQTNFIISDERAEEFFNSLKLSCNNTGSERTPRFGNESSYLSTQVRSIKNSNTILAIDVGGTRTKVCIRTSANGNIDWLEILDLDNNQLKTEGALSGLSRMTLELGKQIAISCQSKEIALKFDGISIVWSNKLECFPLIGELRGVGAKVFGSQSGQGYRKGEWWNSDIADGDSISDAFKTGLSASSIDCKILVVGNDTVFTAKALPNAHAGVVASTGANCTIVPPGSSILYNSECAAGIEPPASFLGLKHETAKLPNSNFPIKFEDLCAGKGLALLFQLYISEALMRGANQLTSIEQALEKAPINAKEFASIAAGNITETLGGRITSKIDDTAIKSSLEIAQQIVKNAGKMCAVLILISIANQLESLDEILVALDSSQARFVPGYKEAIDSFLSEWNKKNNKKIRYELLAPQGQISVPLRGAANAIEEFL